MTDEDKIRIRFALPAPELAPFVTTYYYTDCNTGVGEAWIEDYLHPEWANLRFIRAGQSSHAFGDGPLEQTPCFAATGPTSLATRFRLSSGRSWGIGLLPLGWAKFIDAAAADHADRAVDGMRDPAFAAFAPLGDALAKGDGDFLQELGLIEQHLKTLLRRPARDAEAITEINAALVDSNIATVADLADRSGIQVRTLERLSRRYFGFPPKLLLRRQRFIRSLAQFMLDPTLKWLNAIDYQYHDQAHFVRDFRRFMGMSPTAYGKLDHPFLRAAARGRQEIAGEAMQALHIPATPAWAK